MTHPVRECLIHSRPSSEEMSQWEFYSIFQHVWHLQTDDVVGNFQNRSVISLGLLELLAPVTSSLCNTRSDQWELVKFPGREIGGTSLSLLFSTIKPSKLSKIGRIALGWASCVFGSCSVAASLTVCALSSSPLRLCTLDDLILDLGLSSFCLSGTEKKNSHTQVSELLPLSEWSLFHPGKELHAAFFVFTCVKTKKKKVCLIYI